MTNVLFVPGFVCDTWSPIENYTLELCKLVSSNVNVTWLVPTINNRFNIYKRPNIKDTLQQPLYVTKLKKENFDILEVDLHKFNIFHNCLILKKIIQSKNIDTVYVQFGYERYMIPIISKVLGCKVIYHEHGYPPNLKYPLLRHHFYNNFVDSFLTISNFVAKELPSYKPIEVVHNSIDTLDESQIISYKEQSKELRNNILNGNSGKIVVMVAAFRDMKRHDLALEVISNVVSKYTGNIKFVLLGSGSLYDKYKHETIERGLDHCVLMPGHVDNVTSYLAAADISMLTSLAEPFGVSLIESMNMMLPTMSFASGSAQEIIIDGHDGVLIELANTEQYSDKMLQILNSESLCKTLGKNAYHSTIKNFAHEKWKKDIKNSFLKLVQEL
ncbi:glycosyltransferase family 4 protein [Vibrio sp. DNB22_19_1]